MPTNLQPISQTSAIILSSTGSTDDVASAVPFGMYTGSAEFITGAARQVNYVFKKLGGDVVDIELTDDNVYAAYEEAVLEYSYLVNKQLLRQLQHQAQMMMVQQFPTLEKLETLESSSIKFFIALQSLCGASMATMVVWGW